MCSHEQATQLWNSVADSAELDGCESKISTPNGTLASGNMDQNLWSPGGLILSHTQMADVHKHNHKQNEAKKPAIHTHLSEIVHLHLTGKKSPQALNIAQGSLCFSFKHHPTSRKVTLHWHKLYKQSCLNLQTRGALATVNSNQHVLNMCASRPTLRQSLARGPTLSVRPEKRRFSPAVRLDFDSKCEVLFRSIVGCF